MSRKICAHLTAISEVKLPKRRVCEECIKTGFDRRR